MISQIWFKIEYGKVLLSIDNSYHQVPVTDPHWRMEFEDAIQM